MASHRKPKQRSLTGNTVRTTITLALAGATSVTALGETGHADPEPTPGQVKAEVDALYRQAEEATERYDGAQEKAETARTRIAGLQDELARRTDRLNATRNTLGSIASAQYRSGGVDPAMQLALDSDPDQYLARAGVLTRVSARQAAALRTLRDQRRGIRQIQEQAETQLATLRAARTELAAHKSAIENRLGTARRLLDRLTASQRAAVAAADDAGTGGSGPVSLSPDDMSAPSARAARAVAYARGALGLPYVWGATGPSGYDCSGLTQAAWRAAGVSLPRTTYTQINAGERVSRSQLRPGDLVFFYSGISHVGLYIGGGRMIHAPHPGAPIRIAPIDQMPFAGAARPV